MWFWKKKSEPATPPAPTTQVAELTFSVTPDGAGMKVIANWPTPENEQHGEFIVEKMASLVHCVHRGLVLSLIQQAIAIHGKKSDTEKVASSVLTLLNDTLAVSQEDDGNVVVVCPTTALSLWEKDKKE